MNDTAAKGEKMSRSYTKQVTLHEVAEDAGVSHQTVSRVINGSPHVATNTRKRVLASIKRLNYRPNFMARGLVMQRSHTVGVVSFGTNFYGPAQMVDNIDRSLQERGYGFTTTTIRKMTIGHLRVAVQKLRDQAVDGIVMITPIHSINLDPVQKLCTGIPFVMIDIALGAQLPSVVIDQHCGGRLATQHLLDLGHEQIVEISGPLDWSDASLRHQGWLDAMKRAGLKPGRSIESDWSAAGGYEATQTLLRDGVSFTGLVAGNDQMALGALRALRELGLNVPKDVSVVGFDNLPESAFFEPPLTSVKQDFTALGRQSAEYLVALIEDPEMPPQQRVLYPELVIRQSTRQRSSE